MAVSDVLVGAPVTGTGGILRAPVGSTLPTDATATLDAAFIPQGYISEDGVTMTTDRSTEKVKAWGGDTVRIIQSDYVNTFQFTFLETTSVTLSALHGDDNVSTSGGGTAVTINGKVLPTSAWVFEILDGENRIRIVAPNAQVTEVGEVQFSHNAVTQRQLTVEALPDEDGNTAYMYLVADGGDDENP